MRAEAIQDFEPKGLDQESQLSLAIGDQLQVLVQDDSGWWAGHKEGSDVTGWFPRRSVVLLAAVDSTCSATSVSSNAPFTSNPVSTSNGRRVASPQVAGPGAPKTSKSTLPNRRQERAPTSSFMKLHRTPMRSPRQGAPAASASSGKPGSTSVSTQTALIENLAKAFEVERRFSKGLEEELRCLRELSTKEVHLAALEKAWQATAEPDTSVTVSSKTVPTPTVRALVAAFEQRGRSAAVPAESEGHGMVRNSSWHCL